MAKTLRDVAEAAGVSVSTVSRVLNNDGRITKETRTRVLESVRDLDYKINAVARSLKLRQTRIVGFVTPEIANDFFMSVAQGVEDELQRCGYNMIICNSNEDVAREASRVALLLEQWVDGMIVAPAGPEGPHLKALVEGGTPLVLVDRLVRGLLCDAVLVDNRGGTRAAVTALLERGYRRFGFIGGDPQLTTANERYLGFEEAISAAGVRLPTDLVVLEDFHVTGGYRAMGRLLSHSPLPEVVFVANYFMQIGAARRLYEHGGINDVLLAGFDDLDLTSVPGPAALTIRQPVAEIGRRAARILVSRIDGTDSSPPRVHRLATTIVERRPG